MRRALIETITRSEKRKDVLMILQDGPVDMPVILKTLNESRPALLPQMKILEEGQLVIKEKDAYMLSKFGKLIVKDLKPLLGTLDILEGKLDYWTKHNTDCIPQELFNRLRELESSELIEPELCEAVELSRKAISMCLESKMIDAITSLYHSEYPSLFMKYAENGTDFRCIFTKEVLSRFVSDNEEHLQKLMEYPNVNFYIYPDELHFSALMITPDFMLLRLLTISEVYDPRYIMAYKQSAINWGKEFFQCFADRSALLEAL
ncbi:winged helix-turn-helix domain-containing protein [uncultured Methanolobus sp.]|uniref:helix-turn-helix transcriptional regulator n=1 Tax=uncultured Methanolobus sp. TaxID=218300 RepID=UPI0029C60442|nr:winged helix-turn-helix domain-containing protein [uncultured Methanolobus sp.]